MNLFIAHPKGYPERELVKVLEVVRVRWPEDVAVKAIDDFRQRARALGSWNAWGRSVVERFDRFVVVPRLGTEFVVGRGTANLVDLALTHRRDVRLLDGRQITALIEQDADDWKQGWTLLVDGVTL